MSKVRSITPKDPADFTPELGNYKTLQPFRYWCQKVLPLVYDDSLSYYELLCKVVDYLNKTMEDVETLHGDVTNLHSAYEELQSYVNDYFSTLDVQEEINNKLDDMLEKGELNELLGLFIPYVTPEMYGAIGDGVTNDTVAFQNAVNTGLPVILRKSYLLDKINNVGIIIGNNNTIINNSNDTLFSGNEIYISNINISNKEIFDYENSKDVYGTIHGKNITCINVTITNINSSGIYANNVRAVNCNFINDNFNVKCIYDGSNNNHSFGIYIYQNEYSDYAEVKNCHFKSLIEGVYYGTYSDDCASTIIISNNKFEIIGDHCEYINSLNDRCTSIFENNMCLYCGTYIAVSGNNHVIRHNVFKYAFNGIRCTFGFSIRDGSNVLFDNNYIDATYTSTTGISADNLITSLISNKPQENIKFINNYINVNNYNDNVPYLRCGYGNNAPINGLIFENNTIIFNGYSSDYGFLFSNVAITGLKFINNNIEYFNMMMNKFTTDCYMESNTFKSLSTNPIALDAKGVWVNNTIIGDSLEIRKATNSNLYCYNNRKNGGLNNVYSIINSENFIDDDTDTIEVESISDSSTTRISSPLLVNGFNKLVMLFKDNVPYIYESAIKESGAIQITLPVGNYVAKIF